MKITLMSGRAHLKHTEGGDFRQAVYRAVRQGLMQADSVLLEPVYGFRLEVPERMLGRAMTDVERMHGQFEPPVMEGEYAVLSGSAPVACRERGNRVLFFRTQNIQEFRHCLNLPFNKLIMSNYYTKL